MDQFVQTSIYLQKRWSASKQWAKGNGGVLLSQYQQTLTPRPPEK